MKVLFIARGSRGSRGYPWLGDKATPATPGYDKYYLILKTMTFPTLASGKKSDMVKLRCLVSRQNYLTHSREVLVNI